MPCVRDWLKREITFGATLAIIIAIQVDINVIWSTIIWCMVHSAVYSIRELDAIPIRWQSGTYTFHLLSSCARVFRFPVSVRCPNPFISSTPETPPLLLLFLVVCAHVDTTETRSPGISGILITMGAENCPTFPNIKRERKEPTGWRVLRTGDHCLRCVIRGVTPWATSFD